MAMRFDDEELVRAYRETGKFPVIHAKIAKMLREHAAEAEPFMDLGSCTGLLSLQAIDVGRSLGVGLEVSRGVLDRAVQHSRVRYECLRIGLDTVARVAQIAADEGVTLVIARRILPEIEEGSPGCLAVLAPALRDAGVKKLVIEGRFVVPRPKAALFSVQREIEALGPAFRESVVVKHCAVLTAA